MAFGLSAEMSWHYSSAGSSTLCYLMWPLQLHPSALNTWYGCSIATISITSIFPDHNSHYLSFLIRSLFFSSIHLLQSVSINYISLYAAAPSITRPDRQAQVNWSAAPYTLHFLLPQFFGPWQEGGEGYLMDRLREASDPAHRCQEGSGDGVLWNTSFTSAYIISFSGTDVATCTPINTHARAQSHQSLAYRKRYQTGRKIELGNMGTVICGKAVLRQGEKIQLGAHFIFKRGQRGRSICVVYLKLPPSSYNGMVWNIHIHVWQDQAHYADLSAGLH